MKSCAYCGKEYPDEASTCAIDGEPLQPLVAEAPAAFTEARRSPLGIVSFGISIAAGVLIVALVVTAGVLSSGRVSQIQSYGGQALVGLAAMFLLAVDGVALGLGVAACCQPGTRRIWGVLGTVVSAATIVGLMGMAAVGLALGARFAR